MRVGGGAAARGSARGAQVAHTLGGELGEATGDRGDEREGLRGGDVGDVGVRDCQADGREGRRIRHRQVQGLRARLELSLERVQ